MFVFNAFSEIAFSKKAAKNSCSSIEVNGVKLQEFIFCDRFGL